MENMAIDILVVDDDVALLGVMEESLALDGHRVQGTHQAKHALETIRGRDFDLVISDYSLNDPAINGLDVLRYARAASAETLGIVVTAYASMEMSLEAIRLGAYDFLSKPFQIEELRLTVRNAAELIVLRSRVDKLASETESMAASLAQFAADEVLISEQIRAMRERLTHTVTLGPAAMAAARSEALQQLQTYERMSESRMEQIEREGKRLEALYEQGLIGEPAYRKWLESRKETLART